MNDKTCGDCKSFPGIGYYCPIIGRFCDPNNEKPCEFFEKPMGRIATNGDRIRQMSNGELAELLTNPPCFFCSRGDTDGACTVTKVSQNCKVAILERLDAPEDCVAENGESAKQADLCCKSANEGEGQ